MAPSASTASSVRKAAASPLLATRTGCPGSICAKNVGEGFALIGIARSVEACALEDFARGGVEHGHIDAAPARGGVCLFAVLVEEGDEAAAGEGFEVGVDGQATPLAVPMRGMARSPGTTERGAAA